MYSYISSFIKVSKDFTAKRPQPEGFYNHTKRPFTFYNIEQCQSDDRRDCVQQFRAHILRIKYDTVGFRVKNVFPFASGVLKWIIYPTFFLHTMGSKNTNWSPLTYTVWTKIYWDILLGHTLFYVTPKKDRQVWNDEEVNYERKYLYLGELSL